VIVDRNIDGLDELVEGELHQLAGGERHSRQAQHRRVPAAGPDVQGIDQPAVDLIREHDRGDEFRGAGPLGLRNREAGRNVVARMTGKARDIDIVQVVIAERGSIGEGGKIGRGAPFGADDARDARVCQRDFTANAHRPLIERRDPTPQRIDDMRFDSFNGRAVEIVIAQAVGVGGEPIGQRTVGRLGAGCQAVKAEGSRANDEFTARGRLTHFRDLAVVGLTPACRNRKAPLDSEPKCDSAWLRLGPTR